MATFEYKGKTFYIDNRLKEQIDKKIIPDLKKKDKDKVFTIDGKEGSGKSKFGDIIAAYIASQLEVDYDLDDVCLSPEEFRNRIQSVEKNKVIVYDEAHKGMGSRRALSEINNILIDLMMEMRQKNLCVIIVLPTFFMLDRYVALFRTTGLFHIYERKGQRGFWVYFNEKNKLKLFIKGKKEFNYNCIKWPRFRGRFLNQYSINEEEYRKKKKKAFEDKTRITRAETYQEHRDKLVYLIAKELNLGAIKLQNMFKEYDIPLKKTFIGEILAKMSGYYGNTPAPTNKI